jgi:hypothetical protein
MPVSLPCAHSRRLRPCPFKEAENATHFRDSVKRSDNVDSRSTRVGKTGADPSGTSVRTRLSAPFVAAFAIISVHLCDNLLGAKQDRGR